MATAININTKYLKNHALQCSQLLSPISFMNSYQYMKLLTYTESLYTILLTSEDYYVWTRLHLHAHYIWWSWKKCMRLRSKPFKYHEGWHTDKYLLTFNRLSFSNTISLQIFGVVTMKLNMIRNGSIVWILPENKFVPSRKKQSSWSFWG